MGMCNRKMHFSAPHLTVERQVIVSPYSNAWERKPLVHLTLIVRYTSLHQSIYTRGKSAC
jgi:hypothetical protein